MRRFASARVARPDSKLFLATLAMACMAPLQPLPAECDAIDRLADWATRDVDNGVPMLLLAEPLAPAQQRDGDGARTSRKRRDGRGSTTTGTQGALAIWEEVRALPGAADPAARAELAASYGAAYEPLRGAAWWRPCCRDAQKAADAIRAACVNAGMATAQRAATWSLRAAGAELAERSAAAGPAQDQARQLLRRRAEAVLRLRGGRQRGRRRRSRRPILRVRARAVAQWEARLAQDARDGEVAACAAAARKG